MLVALVLAMIATTSCGRHHAVKPAAVGAPQVAASAGEAGGSAVRAHYESPPDVIEYLPPCTAQSPVPDAGTCHGTGRSNAPTVVTGSWDGRTEYAYGWIAFASGVTTSSGVATFTGTVQGCGAGTLTYRYMGTNDEQDGKGDDFQWETIEGAGTGALAGARGRGTLKATVHDDLSVSGELEGWVSCQQ